MRTFHRFHAGAIALATAVAVGGCAVPGEGATSGGSGRSEGRLTTAPLPGGTALEVGIDAPLAGSVLAAGAVTVAGTARVGVATPLATDFVFVLDLSGSVESLSGGCGGDRNGDGLPNSVLDCEIQALQAANARLAAAGGVSGVGLVVFGRDANAGDMAPGAGDQRFAPPGADADANGTRDVDQVLASADVQSTTGRLAAFSAKTINANGTSLGAGLAKAVELLAASTADRRIVVFVSDGLANAAPSVASVLPSVPAGVVVVAIASGASAQCAPGGGSFGTLQEMANATGGSCTRVANVAQLPDVAPGLVKATLTGLSIAVDGTAGPPASVEPALPQDGPASVAWSAALAGLAPGPHEVCATASGRDAGGAGTATECVAFRIARPPVAACRDATVSAGEGCRATASVDATPPDPEDPQVCVQEPPGPYPLGTTQVELTCTRGGASASCSGTVTVVDDAPPVFGPAPAPVSAHRSKPDLGPVAAADACGAVVLANDAPRHFRCGKTVVTWTATDEAGNAATASQEVTRLCNGLGHGPHDGPCDRDDVGDGESCGHAGHECPGPDAHGPPGKKLR